MLEVVNGTITGELAVTQTVTGAISAPQSIEGALSIVGERGVSVYAGAYTVTPSTEAQTLETAGFKLTDDITITPIPSNYGRIVWNGATLMVY